MCADKKVPDIRFKGFSGEWEEKILGAIAEIKTGPFGSTLHAKAYVEDGYAIITTEHFKSGELPIDKKGIPQVSDEDYLRLRAYLLKVGDIVFSRVGSVDINAHVTNKQEGWLFSGRVLRVRSEKIINSEYLHHELSTSRVKKSVISRAVGQTMPSINTEILKITPIHFPSDTVEQTTIGNYFQKLDNLINQHQQKHDKLSNIKKAMLEKMFPKQGETVPEIRFKGFSGEWEEIQLEQIAGVRRGLTYKPSDISEDGIVVLRSSNINVDKFELRKDDVKVNQEAVKIGLIKNGDILITSANGSSNLVGKHTVVKGLIVNAVHGGFMLVATTKIPYFLNASMSTYWYQRFLSINVSGGNGAIGNIKGRALEEVRLYIPKQEEQTAIGNYFQKLDELINQHQQQITKLNHIKQACLSKMFI
ncbi:restriction endonuclease subunit S [Proteus penneri]|uniref:restriction endonuclease subunit S n=1 Tax=Proteus penneri TaxID=102862 RepID=UPI000E01A874|nr:restriction endonuclease subunit S [Proteus penneri]SUB98953.1 EcoKI restriction-modification system protein HsdS [Proteus penneri]